MFHCNGWCYTWAVTAAGAKHVCLRKVDHPHIFHLLHAEGITHACAAPVVVSGMSAHALKHHEQQPFLKGIKLMTAGAPPAPKVPCVVKGFLFGLRGRGSYFFFCLDCLNSIRRISFGSVA